ncbi:MAG: YhbY family RNA-binding protein [Pseudobutyrivibrio sp.]|nr:YhbY family RNA-binding protein [Pseudobutyrivibrio sp.]
MNNKQRAYLSSLSSDMNAIMQIGKASLTPEIVSAVDEALAARELIKISVLKNCFDDPKEIAQTMAERTHSEVVRVIGKKIILYRAAKKPVIKLPE